MPTATRLREASPTLTPALDASARLPGALSLCSWRGGWRSLLLRGYDEPAFTEAFTTLPTTDQLIVLVTAGRCRIESYRRGSWSEAHYGVGSLGMSAPGESATLRWREGTPNSTLQLHIPGSTIRAAAADLWAVDAGKISMPGHLLSNDPLIQATMLTLGRAVEAGAPELYAETAASFLAVHLLQAHVGAVPAIANGREEARLARVNAYMRDHLHEQISLADLAREANFSRFHLLRLFKKTFGETPFTRLSRMRVEQASFLLRTTNHSITQIAFNCGFGNSSHFASTFRRATGVPPSLYRDLASSTDPTRG